MSEQEDLEKAKSFAYFFLKFRMRTEKEVRLYLLKKNQKFHWSEKTVDLAIDALKKTGLIDDRKFVKSFVNDRSSMKPKGKAVLQRELVRLGVEKTLIDDFFYTYSLDEATLCKRLLSSRWRRWQNLPKEKKRQKAYQFLVRRGFDFDTIKKTIVNFEQRE
jgi:regulatory protein